MSRLYVSTACLSPAEGLLARLTAYEAHGLNAIELGAGVTIGDPGVFETKNLPALKTGGRRFLIHNYFPPPRESFVLNLASPDDALRRRSLDFVTAALDLAARLDVPYYSVHAGFVVDPLEMGPTSFRFPPLPSPDEPRRAMERFVSAIEPAVSHAESVGVGLLVENNVCPADLRGKLLLQTAEEFRDLLDACPSESLGVLLDTGHLQVAARTFGFDCAGFVDALGPYVKVVHVHDNDGFVDTHEPIGADGWAAKMLGTPPLADVPVVVEARFDSMDSLLAHVRWLESDVLARRPSSGD